MNGTVLNAILTTNSLNVSVSCALVASLCEIKLLLISFHYCKLAAWLVTGNRVRHPCCSPPLR